MNTLSLPDTMLEPLVRAALAEDLGRVGDVTSQALLGADHQWQAALVARKAGSLAGMDAARLAFQLMDRSVQFESMKTDGDALLPGDVLARVSGSARALLAAERTALNFLCHLSGIATLTQSYVLAVRPHKATICCTRKTTPGLRALEKMAVRAGGGSNHRFGLDDAVMIKDNHIAVVGDIRKAVIRAREAVGHMMKIEVEVDRLAQLESLMDLPVDVVLLDNMPLEEMKACVALASGRFVLEASGGVTLDTVNAIAATGVDVISVGALTHSAPILDIALDEVDGQTK